MSWDGTHLGEGVIVAEWKAPHGEKMCRVEVAGQTLLGYLCDGDVAFSAFVEAIKPLFGLEQRGHHLLAVGGKQRILYYAHSAVSNGVRSVREYALSAVAADHPLRAMVETGEAVRRILAFRDTCLLGPVDERAVLVRVVDGGHVFLSMRETKVVSNEARHRISQRLFGLWFGEGRSVAAELRAAFGGDEHASYRLGCQLEAHVAAYGAGLSEYRYTICKRLALQLQN